ncbi:MAG: hypothetical protein JW737_04110 [Acidobacteria bacterium]|nr:hypothetical protein [Acidobacteriota bacterium]
MKSDFIITKKRIIPVIVVLIILAYLAVLYLNKVDQDNMFDEALRLQNLQRWQEAAELYKQISIKYYGSSRALEADFRSAEIYYYNLGSRRLAEIELEKLIKEKLDSELKVKTTLLLARIYSDDPEQLEDALELLKRCRHEELSTKEKKLIDIESAEIYRKMGNFTETAKLYEVHRDDLQTPQEKIEILMQLSSAYTSCFERKKAEKIYRELLATKELDDAKRTRVEWLLFSNLDEQDKLAEALEIINNMINKEPSNLTYKAERKRIQEEIEFIRKTRNKEWWQ